MMSCATRGEGGGPFMFTHHMHWKMVVYQNVTLECYPLWMFTCEPMGYRSTKIVALDALDILFAFDPVENLYIICQR